MSHRIEWYREHLAKLCRTRALSVVVIAVVILAFALSGEVRNIRRTEPNVFSPQQRPQNHPLAITYSDSRIPLHIALPFFSTNNDRTWRCVSRVVSGILNETLLRNVTVHVVSDAFDSEPDPHRRSAAVVAATQLHNPRLEFVVYRFCDLFVDEKGASGSGCKHSRALPGARSFSRLLLQFSSALHEPKSEKKIASTLLGLFAYRWLGSLSVGSSSSLPEVVLFLDPVGLRVAGDMWDAVTGYLTRMHEIGSLVGVAAEERPEWGVNPLYNGAVQLLDLRSMRDNSKYGLWLSHFNVSDELQHWNTKAVAPPLLWNAASLIFSRLANDAPSWVFRMGCEWNRQPFCDLSAPKSSPQLNSLCSRVVRLLYSPETWRRDMAPGAASVTRFPGCGALSSPPGDSCGQGLRDSHARFEGAAIAALPTVDALDALEADKMTALWALSAVFKRRSNLTASS